MEKALEFAVEIARSAGKVQKDNYEKRGLVVHHKGLINLVTEVDLECEKLIVSAISKKYPGHDILAEEGTDVKSDSGYAWYIDPLDGTTNYAHGFPVFAPSVALAYKGEPLVGAVYDPLRDEMFSGIKGGGAFLNGNRLAVSKVDNIDGALLGTGFPYDLRTNKANNIENFNNAAMHCQAVRRAGAAALDLCYVACGRFEGFWEQWLYAWDMAAGALFVAEAGGVVTNMKGKPLDLFGKTICAGNPAIHPKLLSLLTGPS
ncbi:MAG: inositol monophosphatase [Nitrospinae bacterium]|nr:inositol monophosphatase [Nitrospinota bacterium]